MIFSLSYISVLFTKKESLKKCKDFTKTGAVQDDFEHFYQKIFPLFSTIFSFKYYLNSGYLSLIILSMA